MLTLQEAFRTWMTTLRKTTVAESTSRKATDMPADAVEDLGSFSLLLFCWVIVICNMTMDLSGSRCPKLSF